jgi:hypothetical protein
LLFTCARTAPPNLALGAITASPGMRDQLRAAPMQTNGWFVKALAVPAAAAEPQGLCRTRIYIDFNHSFV